MIRLKNQMRIAASDETIRWIRDFVDQRRIYPIPPTTAMICRSLTIHAQWKMQLPDLTPKITVMASVEWWRRLTGNIPATSPKMAATGASAKGIVDAMEPAAEKQRQKINGVKYSDLSWAEQPHTIHEIGSTYTVQGFDLNHVGVVIGPSVKYRDGKVIFDPQCQCQQKSRAASNHEG